MYSGPLSTLMVPGLPRHSMFEEDQKTIWEIVFPTIGKVHLDAQPFTVEVVQHV